MTQNALAYSAAMKKIFTEWVLGGGRGEGDHLSEGSFMAFINELTIDNDRGGGRNREMTIEF
jgi:hypothetical protein